MPLDIPGQRNSTPSWTGGASPGVKVVMAEIIVDFDGPRDSAPPQVSRLIREAALAVAASNATKEVPM